MYRVRISFKNSLGHFKPGDTYPSNGVDLKELLRVCLIIEDKKILEEKKPEVQVEPEQKPKKKRKVSF